MTTGSTDYRSNPGSSSSSGIGGAGASKDLNDVKETAKHTFQSTKDEVLGLGQELKNQGSDLVGAARQRAQGLAEQQVAFGADTVGGVARAATKAADELEQSSPQLASYVRDAASAVEDFSSSLRNRSLGDIMQDVTNFARREPVMFFGITVAAGFALSRFLKSSADTGSSYGSASTGGSGYGSTGGSSYAGGGSGTSNGGSYANRGADIGESKMPVASTHATPAEFPTGRTTTTDPMGSSGTSTSGTGSSGIGSAGVGSAGIGSSGAGSSGLGGSASGSTPSGTSVIGSSSSPTRTTFPSGTTSSGTSGIGNAPKSTGGSST